MSLYSLSVWHRVQDLLHKTGIVYFVRKLWCKDSIVKLIRHNIQHEELQSYILMVNFKQFHGLELD